MTRVPEQHGEAGAVTAGTDHRDVFGTHCRGPYHARRGRHAPPARHAPHAPHSAWRDEPDAYRDGESFELPGLTRTLAVHEVYDGLLDAAGRSLLR